MRALAIPELFGERPCDRRFLAIARRLPGSPDEGFVKLAMFLIWMDFARHPDARREVPLESPDFEACLTVSDLEMVAGWHGPPGLFVLAAVEAGFLVKQAITESDGLLVPSDFGACSVGSGGAINHQRKGGAVHGRRSAQQHAEKQAREMGDLFDRRKQDVFAGVGVERGKEAMLFVLTVCRIMKWSPPVESAWTPSLIEDADGILQSCDQAELNAKMESLVLERGRDELPGRVDLLLKAWNRIPVSV